MIGSAVERADGDDVALAALVRHGEQHRGHRGHAGGERDSLLGVLEASERLLEARDRRVPEPRVDVGSALERVPAGREDLVRQAADVDPGERVRRREIEGESVYAQLSEIVAAGVHGKAVRVQRHRCHAAIVGDFAGNHNSS